MSAARPAVLVVDRDHDTRLALARSLSGAGFRTITAGDASTALWYARRIAPEAVVLDSREHDEALRLGLLLRRETGAGVVFTSRQGTAVPAVHRGGFTQVATLDDPEKLVAAVRCAAATHATANDGPPQQHCRSSTTEMTRRHEQLAALMAGATSAAAAHAAIEKSFSSGVPPLMVHQRRVAAIACEIARDLYLGEHEIAAIEGAALLHDAGKLVLPDAVLAGHAEIGDDEMAVLEAAHERTLDLLNRAPALSGAAAVIRHTCERWDGTGGPEGLAGEAIPLAARIVALADAMDHARRDAGAGSPAADRGAQAVIGARAGTWFDPDLVQVCLHMGAVACS